MAEFDYVAIDPVGKDRKGSIKADTIEEARAKLDARKLFIVTLEPGAVESARSRANLSLRSPRLSAKELTLFTRQLATLTQVSPLEESLRTIGRQSEQDHVRAVVGKVHSGVMEGRRLADALGAEPKSFPPLYRAMISAGESSGSLPTIMERLSDLMERQALMRSKVLTAIAYPSVLATFAVFVVAALMIFVVPKVVEQFDTVGQELPLLTRMVMGLSAFLAAYWWLLLIAMILGGVAFWRALKNERFRYRFDATLLGLPVLGKLIRDLHAARMARTLSTMVASRLPLMEGLTLTANTVHNRVLRRASDEIVEAIRGGGSLSAALRRGVPSAAGLSRGERRKRRAARHHVGARGGLSGARVRFVHLDCARHAGADHHHFDGRHRRRHHPVHPAADFAVAKPDRGLGVEYV